MSLEPHKKIRLAAVGDLLFTSRHDGDPAARGLEALADDVRELFASCDLVFANLECTLPGKDRVASEPLVLATAHQLGSLKEAGVNVVTLANNHAFDCFDEGFARLARCLDDLGVARFGAGRDHPEASRPLIVEINGRSLAFIGVVDKSSGAQRFAHGTASGVVSLEVEAICRQIRAVKKQVDHVVVSPHWGWERFRIPSPQQLEQGRAFVDAGACAVLGHHPHVMQGMERYRGAAIAYSLGNFLANPVYWRNGDQLTWSRFERTGVVLVVEFGGDGDLAVEQIPVFDDGTTVTLDRSPCGRSYVERANRLVRRGVTERAYRRERFFVQTVKPVLGQLRWAKLKRVRPAHLGKLWRLLSQP